MINIIVDTNYPGYGYLDTELYFEFLRKHNEDYISCLNELLDTELDCTKINKKGKQLITTISYSYEMAIYLYIRILNKIKDYIVYNTYYDLLMNKHNDNLDFEKYYTVEIPQKKTKVKKEKVKKVKVENKFIRKVTSDLFTNKEIYIYFNPKTGEEIESDNPNLLDELNERLKNKRKSKSNNYIKPEHLHFNFNKK